MAINNNITINSKPGYGYTLTRTSYDIHQEISAKVIGVLKYNNNIREKLLRRNIGIYNQVKSEEGIGYISDLFSNESNKPFSLGEDGLFGYTHINQSDYQEKINQKYDLGSIISYYKSGNLPNDINLNWKGLYRDYTKYIDEVYGFKYTSLNLLSDLFQVDKLKKTLKLSSSQENFLTLQSVLNDFLQYDNIKYAMEKSRIGIVIPNPIAALSGAITTNINNFSGTDTSLGLISNYLYAHTLRNGAQFNSLRKTKYITPEVYNILGNKLSTISTLASDFRIDDETGRLAFDLGEGEYIKSYSNPHYSGTLEEDLLKININLYNQLIENYKNINSNHYLLNYGYYFQDVQEGTIGRSRDNLENQTTFRGNINNVLTNTIYKVWDEDNSINTYISGYENIKNEEFDNGIISKVTETWNVINKNETLISRFHTKNNSENSKSNLFQTAVTNFGISHGRNLLTKDAYKNGKGKDIHGYDNPYCRTWTYHHQYDSIDKLIRPSKLLNDDITKKWEEYGRREGSGKRLKDYSVLNNNGFVNITPLETVNDGKDIKKCMFSIENLAWKDVDFNTERNLSKEQQGPNGGRIMWFPPYGLTFNENISANWNQVDFIGRGEKVYTYTNTERSGTLSFIMLVDHPSVLDIWKKNHSNSEIRIDEKEDDEQSILRFFAGCDELEINGKKELKRTIIEKEIPPLDSPIIPIEKDPDDIIFYIFFPNNYSGNDNLTPNEAIEYIALDYESEYNTTVGNKEPIYEGYKWTHRVDTAVIDEKPTNYNGGYHDNKNYHLNSELLKVKEENFFSDANTTFAEIYTDSNLIIGDSIITGGTVQGFASSHGNKSKNKVLFNNRANFALLYLRNILGISIDKITKLDGNEIEVGDGLNKDVSSEKAKRCRCAKVVLKRKKGTPVKPLEEIKLDKIPVEYNEENISNLELKHFKPTYIDTKKDKRTKRNKNNYSSEESKNNALESLRNNQPALLQNYDTDTFISDFNKIAPRTEIASAKIYETIIEEIDLSEKNKTSRWDKEAQYFELLKENDNFLYTKIIDKIKYFTPAFHSITPEGFNARLAFLHQCTRQGQTNSVSDTNNSLKSAGNLSFGRPPICVLRLGDFYNTKIIIESITIDYDTGGGIQWDMNQEGIGLQPVFAKISLNFKFLGGSDISAPISRLQNAVSFNYYANQSIYDDRADIGIYKTETDEEGNIKYTSDIRIEGEPWKPN